MVLAAAGIEPPADSGTTVIDHAAMGAIQVPAPILHIKIPPPPLDKDGGPLVADVPADILKIIPRCRPVNLQCKIAAAECSALFTGSTHPISLPGHRGRNNPLSAARG